MECSKQGRSALTMRIFLPHFPEIAFVFFMTVAVAPGSGGGLDDTLDMKNCLGNRERPDLALSITRCQRAHRTIRPGGYLGLNNFHISCLAVPFPCAPTRLPRMIYLREGQLAVLLAHFCVMSDWTAAAGHSLYYR